MNKKPLTSTEKSVLFRKRNAELGCAELRGIWATKDEQVVLKKLMRDKLTELRNKQLNTKSTIMRYKKKPIVIEAVLLEPTEKSIREVLAFKSDPAETNFATDAFESYCKHRIDDGFLKINTLEGTMKASFGDYIIKGVQGEFYPCKPSIFAQTYDAL